MNACRKATKISTTLGAKARKDKLQDSLLGFFLGALNGFLMMVAAFLMGGWLGKHMDGSVFPLTNGLWFWSVIIALSAWTLVQRHGDPARAT